MSARGWMITSNPQGLILLLVCLVVLQTGQLPFCVFLKHPESVETPRISWRKNHPTFAEQIIWYCWCFHLTRMKKTPCKNNGIFPIINWWVYRISEPSRRISMPEWTSELDFLEPLGLSPPRPVPSFFGTHFDLPKGTVAGWRASSSKTLRPFFFRHPFFLGLIKQSSLP